MKPPNVKTFICYVRDINITYEINISHGLNQINIKVINISHYFNEKDRIEGLYTFFCVTK